MGKLILYNLQNLDIFADTVRSKFLKSGSPGGKYSFFINDFNNLFDEILIYNGPNDLSSFRLLNNNLKYINNIEIKLWIKFNSFNFKKISYVSNLNNVSKKDFLFGCSRTLLNLEELEELKNCKCKKIFFLTHYFYETKKLSEKLKKINVDLLISENNLFKNSLFFRKYFNFYQRDVYHIPFLPQKRFKNSKKFIDRQNKCIATGSWRYYSGAKFEHFLTFFNTDTLHPFRKLIANNSKYFKNLIVNSMSNDFDFDVYKNIDKDDSLINKLSKKYHNIFKVKSIYLKKDIVEEYNNYMMAIIPEEIVDLPGIGFFEAISCGCVCFAKESAMYSDLGLISGKHYINYDSKKDLKEKIIFYQKNIDKLLLIQRNSLEFVHNSLDSKQVIVKLYKYILKL
jgi:hypothetical protein